MAVQVTPAVVCDDRFSYSARTRTLTVDASDLQLKGIPKELVVISPRTNRRERFNFVKHNRNREGEVVSWTYMSEDPNLNIRIFVYND